MTQFAGTTPESNPSVKLAVIMDFAPAVGVKLLLRIPEGIKAALMQTSTANTNRVRLCANRFTAVSPTRLLRLIQERAFFCVVVFIFPLTKVMSRWLICVFSKEQLL